MTPEQYISKLQELSRLSADSIIIPAGNELLATVKNRIVLDGKNSTGNKIGDYSTKSAYFGKEQFDRKSSFKPQGKNTKGKSASTHKTMYLPMGYKELRDVQGKPTDNIKANYTGSTMAAYQQVAGNKEVLQGFTTDKSSKIRKGIEAKKGDIYKPTNEELNSYNKTVAEGLLQIQTAILR